MTKSSRPQSISDSVSVAGSQGTLDDLRARVASVPEAPTREPVDSRDEQAWSYCLRLLTSRARTRAELTERLARRGYPDDVSERIMDRLATAGLVNDADFATQWVQSRHTYSGKGKRALAAELRTKGVSAENAAAALAQIDGEAERSRAAESSQRNSGRRISTTAGSRQRDGWSPCWHGADMASRWPTTW